MNMRQQFVQTVSNLLDQDPNLVLLLGDIGVFGFRNAFEQHPDRVYNIGILEPSMVSLAAGLSKQKFIPIAHTIAPFLVERSFEQLKIDFGYQQLRGNFVSVGASYDYASLGCTHHCPGDISLLSTIPGMQIIVPGHPKEFDTLFKQTYSNQSSTYYRLSETQNTDPINVDFGQAQVVKKGQKLTILAVGPLLNNVLIASADLDVTIIYYTTLHPFDSATLKNNLTKNKLLVVEPFYSGTLSSSIQNSLFPKEAIVD